MLNNELVKCRSEDNIPLLANNQYNKSKNKFHRLTKSNHETIISEWVVSVDDESEFDSGNFAHNYVEINSLQAVIHIIKCSIGTGVLALPSALRYSGYILGSLSVFILSIINLYSAHLLIEVITNIRSKNTRKIQNLDYQNTVRLCFENSTEKLRKYAWLHWVLLISIALAQIGFLSSYHIFVAENTKYLIDYYVANSKYNLSIWQYQLIFFFLLTPLLFFKTLDKLSYCCQLANILMAISLLLSLIYCYLDPLPIENLEMIKISDSTLLCFGIVIFSFESINLINPIENNLKCKEQMGKICGILNIAFLFIMPVYIVVGFSGYLKFGEHIASSLILSIPMDKWYFMLVKPFYIISIIISYGLQGYVMHNIVWKRLETLFKTKKKKKIADILTRISIGTSTTILSISIPHFDLFISLVGAFSGSSIALIFPAICHSVMICTNKVGNFWKFKLFINGLIFAVGIIGCGLGTYSSIVNINRVIKN